MDDFSHVDAAGKVAMVDVGNKTPTKRTASARAIVCVNDAILLRLENNEITTPKGAVFSTAIVAGIMAAKNTGNLIPLCHPIGMDNCNITIEINKDKEIEIICTATVFAKTGIEMEALIGASIAALTVYDMCKALSHNIVIKETRLISKTGGKKDFQHVQ